MKLGAACNIVREFKIEQALEGGSFDTLGARARLRFLSRPYLDSQRQLSRVSLDAQNNYQYQRYGNCAYFCVEIAFRVHSSTSRAYKSLSQLGTLHNSLVLVQTGSALPSSDPTLEFHLMKLLQCVDGYSYLRILFYQILTGILIPRPASLPDLKRLRFPHPALCL